MSDPAEHRRALREQDRDNKHLFWYWLPVAGAAVCPIFLVLERSLGS